MLRTRAQHNEHEKAERIKTSKRLYMRKKRAKNQQELLCLTGPLPLPHGNSLSSPPLTQQQKAVKKRIQNRLAQQNSRMRKRLLLPMFRLCDQEEMSKTNSWFALQAGVFRYTLHLPRWEMYSTKLGSIYKHGRLVLDKSGINGPTQTPKQEDHGVDDQHWVEIPDNTVQFLDKERDLLHVARARAPILDPSHQFPIPNSIYSNGVLDVNFSIIVNGLMAAGSGDKLRSPDAKRISFTFNEYRTPTGFGHVDRVLGSNAAAFKKEIGRVAELLCAAMQKMQAASGNHAIWTDGDIDAGFAAKLRKRLFLYGNSPMRAEMVVACTMRLTPTPPRNDLHRDLKNPTQTGYNRNGTFSALVTDEKGELHLVQVLVASRRYAKTIGKRGLK